jgi:hypothetical protein
MNAHEIARWATALPDQFATRLPAQTLAELHDRTGRGRPAVDAVQDTSACQDLRLYRCVRVGQHRDVRSGSFLASAGMYKDADDCIDAHGTVMHASGWCA